MLLLPKGNSEDKKVETTKMNHIKNITSQNVLVLFLLPKSFSLENVLKEWAG
jgi:hypothetical protein